jgi:hypothetical protein
MAVLFLYPLYLTFNSCRKYAVRYSNSILHLVTSDLGISFYNHKLMVLKYMTKYPGKLGSCCEVNVE